MSIKWSSIPKWILKSEYVMLLDQDDDFPKESEKYILPNILTNENLEKVIKSVMYFGVVPLNFYTYIKNCDLNQLIELNDNQFIKMLIDFKNIDEDDIFEWAIQTNNPEIAIWAKENNYPYESMAMYTAIEINNLRLLNLLYENKFDVPLNLYVVVFQKGNLEILKYCIERFPVDKNRFLLDSAAIDGNMDCIKYAYDHGFTYSKSFIRLALSSDNIKSVDFAVEHNFPEVNKYRIFIDNLIRTGKSKYYID